jgi:hypothetical protein
MNPQRLLSIVCLSLGMLVGGPAALAQPTSITPAVISASDLSQEQKDQIKQFVDAHKGGMSGTPTEIKRSRNALLEALRGTDVSVAFRLEYARQLVPVLRPLLADKREVVAVNALRVAGELGTASGVDLLSEGLKDQRPGVRYAAAAGFESTFQAIRRTVPALAGAQAAKAIDTLEVALTAEKDARVLEGLSLAIQEATRVPNRQVEGLRDAAAFSLARAVSAKAADRSVGAWADAAFRRAVLTIRQTVTNQDINEPRLSDKTLRAAAGMAGDMLAVVSQRMKANGSGDADLALLVSEAEKAVFFISPSLNVANPKETTLSDLVRQGKAAEYQQQVLQLIGPNGLLTSPNFGFSDDHFIKPPK